MDVKCLHPIGVVEVGCVLRVLVSGHCQLELVASGCPDCFLFVVAQHGPLESSGARWQRASSTHEIHKACSSYYTTAKAGDHCQIAPDLVAYFQRLVAQGGARVVVLLRVLCQPAQPSPGSNVIAHE